MSLGALVDLRCPACRAVLATAHWYTNPDGAGRVLVSRAPAVVEEVPTEDPFDGWGFLCKCGAHIVFEVDAVEGRSQDRATKPTSRNKALPGRTL